MDDCIIWSGSIWSKGRYGMMKLNGRSMGAHRAMWILKNGEIPNGLVVCHKCDNGLCVNINHLFLGTLSENMQDCSKKGRLNTPCQKGENNGNAKKNKAEYIAIKNDRRLGLTYSQLKLKYDIKSNGHLKNIIDYKFD